MSEGTLTTPLGGTHPPAAEPRALEFGAVYDELFPFVWRVARRLGVDDAGLDDVCQETFVVVSRRLPEFEQRSSLKTWAFSILQHVVSTYRRTRARKSPVHRADPEVDLERLSARGPAPDEQVGAAQALRLAQAMLAELDDDKRTVFVLIELEGLSAPEVAEATQTNINTVYARLRSARAEFAAAVARLHAAERRGR